MICVVKITELSDKSRVFMLFESNTESFFGGNGQDLKRLIKIHNMHPTNIELLDSETESEHWINKVHHKNNDISKGANYILLCEMYDNRFKTASYDGRISHINSYELKLLARQRRIANCTVEDRALKMEPAYHITNNTQFEEEIAERYKIYEAKSILLGRKMSFEYTVEGTKVKLLKYTGTTKNVIIPKFITTIMKEAFIDCGIETLTLDDGLKYIGTRAFKNCNLSKVTIPQTVKFMGQGVFSTNIRILTVHGAYRNDRVNILSKDTTVLDAIE